MLGWIQITNQPGAWHHAAKSSTLVVYVDDLLMVGGPLHQSRLRKELEGVVAFSDPALPVDRYLGAHDILKNYTDATGQECIRFEVDVKEFCQSACGAYQEDINKLPGAQQLRLQKADT
eukprot:8762006-Heterocapsa_arctica.AAC.1